MPPLTRITGQFGYTHKDPERVYKLSLRAQDSAIQKAQRTSFNTCPQPWDGDDDLVEDSAETPESEHSGPVGTTDSRQEECSPVAVVIPVRRTAAQGAEGENTLPPADSGRNTSNQHPVHSAFDLPTDEAGNPILL